MNKSESNGRIRQVAILLSSVDAATARNLLGQLPTAQARLVRQQLATLQNVTPVERESSLKMLAQLKSRMGTANVPKPSARPVSPAALEASPAEALLSNVSTSIDRVEFTQASISSDEPVSDHSNFMPIQRQSEYPFQSPSWTPTWQQWSGEELARLLTNERPTLIAAVLVQAPTELGSVILESLPSEMATLVLAALPQLHTTDPSVLQEIYSQLHQKLADFQRQSNPANAGLTKLQAILSSVSPYSRKRLEQRLTQADPLLAHSLGVKPVVAIEKPPVSNSEPIDARSHNKPMEKEFVRDKESLPSSIPFPSTLSTIDSPATDFAQFDSFESLISLSSEDLAIVLRSVDPNTVLLAVSGASRTIQNRVETLVDPKEVKRLQERLRTLKSVHLREKLAAQDKIVRSAHALLQSGRIAGLAHLSMLVAA